jgi:hypothetical protein
VSTNREANLRLFVVWEPVLDSDTRPPRDIDMRRVRDSRAKQFWDPELRVSKAFQQMLAQEHVQVTGKRDLVDGEVVWDVLAIFPPGNRWADPPAFFGGPVVSVKQEALAALRDN